MVIGNKIVVNDTMKSKVRLYEVMFGGNELLEYIEGVANTVLKCIEGRDDLEIEYDAPVMGDDGVVNFGYGVCKKGTEYFARINFKINAEGDKLVIFAAKELSGRRVETKIEFHSDDKDMVLEWLKTNTENLMELLSSDIYPLGFTFSR